MKTSLFRSFTLCLTLLAASTGGFAQVTIGSSNPPVSGALLDLKEDVTTSKGLGMPRVKLTELKPDTPAKLSASIGGTGNWILTEHTALAVYNVKEDLCAVDPIYEGVYVFDGEEWQFLGKIKIEEPSPNVHYYSDNRSQLLGNQTYPYRTFGAAGDWMLENMRYVPADGGVTMTESLGDNSYTAKYYAYPNTTTVGTVPVTWSIPQGLLYTYPAATLGVQDTETNNQGQEQPNEGPATPIKGICPPNWHIPSDREWNELEAELYNHAGDYSSYTAAELSNTDIWDPASTPNAWKIEWNTEAGSRGSSGDGGHGLAMQSPCEVPDASYGDTGGKSLSTAQGGFNALIVGYANGGSVASYGANNFFWSASTYFGYSAWNRTVSVQQPQVYREGAGTGRNYLFSVRCKK